MEDISNRTLAILIGIAIIVSFSGILTIPRGGVSVLGAVTNTTSGTANVSIQSVTQIRLNNATVDFGIGFVNSTDVRCILESNNSNRYNSSYGTTIHPCDKVGGGPGFNAPAVTPNFVIENIGNINVTLRINSSFYGGNGSKNGTGAYCGNVGCTTSGFLCDPTNTLQNCTQGVAEYNWSAGANDAAAACTSDNSVSSRSKFNDSMNGTQKVVCMNMDFNPAQNEIRVAIRVAIPRDSKVGLLNDSVLFQADTG